MLPGKLFWGKGGVNLQKWWITISWDTININQEQEYDTYDIWLSEHGDIPRIYDQT